MFAPETDAANPFKPVTPAGLPAAVDTAGSPAFERAHEPAADAEPALEPKPVLEPKAAILPIGVPELGEPELAESENVDPATASWTMAAGAGVFLVLALLVWSLLRKRKNADEIDAKTEAEAEAEAEAGAEAEAEAEAEDSAPESAYEVAAVPVITDIDESENVPELGPDDLIETVPESEPLPEDTIPLIEPEEGDPEPLVFDDDFELSVPDDELEAVLAEPEESAGSEFGLDDFDLSEFDDLPSTEAEKSADKDAGPKPEQTPVNDRKK
jgi:hypothetical protein